MRSFSRHRLGRLLLALLLPAICILPAVAQASRSLLETNPIAPSSRLVLRLHAGGYTIRSSTDDRIHVSETRDGNPAANRSTDIRFRQTSKGARLEIDPPTGHNGPQITVALPGCAALDLKLTAGELVFETVPCDETDADLHTGELRAALGDPAAYRSIKASVSIGEVDAPGLGKNKEDEQHGGFFRSFERGGSGTHTFIAHVGTGQITLDRAKS